MSEWEAQKDRWAHHCQEYGNLVLTREQMGVYLVVNYQISDRSPKGKWEVDEPPGCPWCGHFPVELVIPIQSARSRRKSR